MEQETSTQPSRGAFPREIFLVAARTGWLILAATILALMVHNLPGFFDVLRTPCDNCRYLTYDTVQALSGLGVTPNEFAAVDVIFEAGFVAVWWGVAGLIFWRKPNDWLGLVTSYGLLTFGLSFAHLFVPADQDPYRLITFIGLCTFIPLLYLFPNGNLAPSWTRWLLLGWLVWSFGWFAFAQPEPGGAFWVTYFGMLALGVVCQFYRYFAASNAVQKWQTKWVVYGISLAAVTYLGFLALDLVFSQTYIHRLFDLFIGRLALLFIPLTIGIAIFRSHLLDIDLIIRRTLVYAILTSLLAGFYLGLTIVLTRLVNGLLGTTSQVGIVISTLTVVAMIAPLRRRVQDLVDRRFLRQNLNAQRALDDFSVATRDEVDLSHLQELMVRIVDDTMQPASVAIWLRGIEKSHPGHEAI